MRLHHFSQIAVLSLDTAFVLQNWEEILHLDGDTFCLFDPHFKNGLWIDLHQEFWYEKDRKERIWIYELRVFGKEWIRKVAANW